MVFRNGMVSQAATEKKARCSEPSTAGFARAALASWVGAFLALLEDWNARPGPGIWAPSGRTAPSAPTYFWTNYRFSLELICLLQLVDSIEVRKQFDFRQFSSIRLSSTSEMKEPYGIPSLKKFFLKCAASLREVPELSLS